jgi:hypothetical protein
MLLQPLFAGRALLAGIHHAAHADVVARLEAFDILSDACHAADDLMAGYDRVRRGKPACPVVAGSMQVRMAYTAVEYFDHHVVMPRIAA